MAAVNKYRVLYFIDGMAPSAEQMIESTSYGPHCGFRNVQRIDPNGSLEECDAVAGEAPEAYAWAYPEAVTIAQFYMGELPLAPKALAIAQTAADGQRELEAVSGEPGDPFIPTTARRSAINPPSPHWKPQG